MIRTLDEEKKKIYEMKCGNDVKVKFMLLDMGSYVGHRTRGTFERPRPYWETMGIDVITNNPEHNLNSEFLIDDSGRFLRLIISDDMGHRRVLNAVHPAANMDKEKMEFYYGKGIHNVNGMYIHDTFLESTSTSKSILDILKGKDYYFDETTNSLIDEDGNKAPKCPLTDPEIGALFINAGRSISEQYRAKNNPELLEDISLDELGL